MDKAELIKKGPGKIEDNRPLESLINLLKDEDASVRKKAIKALGKISDSRAVAPLIQALKDRSSTARELAVVSLSKIAKTGSPEPFFRALKDKDHYIRQGAAEVLDKIGWEPSNNIELTYYLAAKQEWNKLPAVGKDAVEPLIDALKGKDSVPDEAIKALGKICDPGVGKLLIPLLPSEAAIAALVKIRDPGAVEPLIKLLKAWSEHTREKAAAALGKIGDPTAIKPLMEALKDDCPDVREKAFEALAEIGDGSALWPLTELREAYFPDRKDLLEVLNKWGAIIFDKEHRANTKNTIEKICRKVLTKNLNFFCRKCFCRYRRHSVMTYLFKGVTYYACRNCHYNSYLLIGIKKAVLLLDHNFKETFVQDGGTLTVNWYIRKEPFDFDEIRITDADDYDVEVLVMKLINDMDKKRRKRLRKIPVYLSPNIKLSQSKMNLLNDNFKIVKWIKQKK